jgi:hypothetical protein
MGRDMEEGWKSGGVVREDLWVEEGTMGIEILCKRSEATMK